MPDHAIPTLESRPSDRHCPNCSAKMEAYLLPTQTHREVELDVCHDCNAIWFDRSESTQLSPDGTVMLFQLINQRGDTAGGSVSRFSEGLRCVTCGNGMRITHDRVRSSRFAYQSCPNGHGRFTTFYNFLAEKQFVRELSAAERAKLATTVQQIRCSGCGAPVNIGRSDACEYCRAPVSVFDRDAAKKAIDHYLRERHRHVPAQPTSGGGGAYPGHPAYDGAELAADILFALGRAASRGLGGGAARALPAAGGAMAGNALADAGGVATGGLLDSLGGAAGSGAANVLPTASDALFGSGAAGNLAQALGSGVAGDAAGALGSGLAEGAGGALGSGLSDVAGSALGSGLADAAAGTLGSGLADAAAGALPSATEALFGNAAGDLLAEVGGNAVESVGGAMADVAGEAASSVGEGIADLVTDGIGSLLGSLFD